MKEIVRKPYYDEPAPGYGFELLVLPNRHKTLYMHDRWSFLSESFTVVDRKKKTDRTVTKTDSSLLVFVCGRGRAEVSYQPNGSYSWRTIRAITHKTKGGRCASQAAAEAAALRSLGVGFLGTPIFGKNRTTTQPQSWEDI